MHPFAWTVLGDNAGPAEIDLARDAFNECSGAGYDGRNLKRFLQKPFEKQCAHKVANSEPQPPRCPVISSEWPGPAREFLFAGWLWDVRSCPTGTPSFCRPNK